jgi:hypothetical protein
MELVDRVQGALAYRSADLANEQRDIHEADEALAEALAALHTGDPHPDFVAAMSQPLGASIVGHGKKLKSIKGMGTVYDWRSSVWTPSNGGKIKPLIFVQHIPVVPNKPGIADFVTLRNVLVAQGLMVQSATDRDGNAALFTPFDSLCFQAKGANSFSCGAEHMHMTTSEPWTKKQLRASAWLCQLAKDKHGIPLTHAKLGKGSGLVRVLKKGQTRHKDVSDFSGQFNRSDPGPGYDFEYVRHCVIYFDKHGHFEGA